MLLLKYTLKALDQNITVVFFMFCNNIFSSFAPKRVNNNRLQGGKEKKIVCLTL